MHSKCRGELINVSDPDLDLCILTLAHQWYQTVKFKLLEY